MPPSSSSTRSRRSCSPATWSLKAMLPIGVVHQVLEELLAGDQVLEELLVVHQVREVL